MKIISWNINGVRSAIKQDFWLWLHHTQPDILCLQETKINNAQLALEMRAQKFFAFENLQPQTKTELFEDDAKSASKQKIKYYYFLHDAAKPGYAGVCTLSKTKPNKITTGLHDARFDAEGRTLFFEFDRFTLLNCYFPNAQRDLARLDIKMIYNDLFLRKLIELRKKNKNPIACGDFNVAHAEIDIKNAKSNRGNSGFTDEEREWFGKLLEQGFVDTFRTQNPHKKDAYTWWSNRPGVRERNIGWRIDYFIVDQKFFPHVKSSSIYPDVLGSDHCPIELLFDS